MRWDGLQYFGLATVFVGFAVPALWPLWMWLRRSHPWHNAKAALLFRAALLGWLVSSLLKVWTSRLTREPFEPLPGPDYSGAFRFGFFESGSVWESIVEGWPSGHTMTAVAMAVSALKSPLFKSNRWAQLAYALAVGLGVSLTVHWFSDVVAGALIGAALGLACQNDSSTTRL